MSNNGRVWYRTINILLSLSRKPTLEAFLTGYETIKIGNGNIFPDQ